MENQKEEQLYKIVPCYVEKRGNLRTLGISSPVEYKEVKNTMVIHIKDKLAPSDLEAVSGQLRIIFGEPIVLFALESDISFFVAQPMTEEEVKEFKAVPKKNTINNIVESN